MSATTLREQEGAHRKEGKSQLSSPVSSDASSCSSTASPSLLRSSIYTSICILLLALVIAVCTSGYYYVRTHFIESALVTVGKSEGELAADAACRRRDVRVSVNSGHCYSNTYKSISPGAIMSAEAIINPAARNVAEAQVALAAGTAAFTQRYVLRDMHKGTRYMLRLCYPGSPSVGYRLNIYEIRRSAVQMREGREYMKDKDRIDWEMEEEGLQTHRLLDTEIKMFATSSDSALLFDPSEHIWYDDGCDSGDKVEEDCQETDPFVPVLEVEPYIMAISSSAEHFSIVYYNLHFHALTWNVMPDIAIPCIVSLTTLVVLVGWRCVFAWLSRAVARDDFAGCEDD